MWGFLGGLEHPDDARQPPATSKSTAAYADDAWGLWVSPCRSWPSFVSGGEGIQVVDGQWLLMNNNSYIPEVSNEMTDVAPELQLFLKSLAGEARVRILVLLGTRGGLTVGEVAEHLGMGLSTVSEHLKELRRAGLVIY